MLTFRLSLIFTLVFSCVVLAQASVGWAQRRHDHSHRPPHGAAHDHRFNDIDQAVKMFESAERDAWQKPEEVMKHLQLRAGDVVADIGAGPGYFTRRFATAVGPQGKAIGLDIETTMVTHINNEAKQHGVANLTARQVPPNDPQLAPQSVDVVFICDTYHHMQDRVAYARLLATALKPGGRIVIIDFYKRELPIGPPVEWKLTPEAVTEEFRQAGFQPLRAVDFLPYQYYLEFTQASSSNTRVTPGINHAFLDPALDVQRSTANFEGESREIFAQRRAITEALQLKPGMAVADIGAGTRVFLELFAQAIRPQGKLYAIDIAPKFIDHLRADKATLTKEIVAPSFRLAEEVTIPGFKENYFLRFTKP